ncbi:hypothetical protein HYH03_009687 [Edaphochlamys debaryana]|uniref:Uncharacterized protein n=1 Tax=Edaphochlamys debaryana TaxID=47281 RepID=A0A835XXY6_9CHLO|nr:hypothetical protein HYH03_009687 [Edaphochlamys debaryana]|eukprot:KAG2491955.1 hypothetical protein HYH03_009687 [Edaphochlamys debaryana]
MASRHNGGELDEQRSYRPQVSARAVPKRDPPGFARPPAPKPLVPQGCVRLQPLPRQVAISGTGPKLSPRQLKAQPAPAAGTESSTGANAASCAAAPSSRNLRTATASTSPSTAASPSSLYRSGPSTTSQAPSPCVSPAAPAFHVASLPNPEPLPLSAQDKLCSCFTEHGLPSMRPLCHSEDSLRLAIKSSQLIQRSQICPVTQLAMRTVFKQEADVVSVVGGKVYTEPKTLCAKYISTGVWAGHGTWRQCEEAARRVYGEFADSLRVEERAAEDGDDPSALINPVLFWDVEAVNGSLYLVLYFEWQPLGSVFDHLLGLAAAAKAAAAAQPTAAAMDWVSFLEALIAYVRMLIGLVAKGIAYSDGKFENAVLALALGGSLTALLIDLHGTGLLPQAPCAGGKTGRRLAKAKRAALLSPMPSIMSTRHSAAPEQRVSVQPELEARRAALRQALDEARAAEKEAHAAMTAAARIARSALAKAHGLSARRGKSQGQLYWRARQDLKDKRRADAAWAEAFKAVQAAAKALIGFNAEIVAWGPGTEALMFRSLDAATLAELHSYCPSGVPENHVTPASHVWQVGGSLEDVVGQVEKVLGGPEGAALAERDVEVLGELRDLAEACQVVRPSQRPDLEWVLQQL